MTSDAFSSAARHWVDVLAWEQRIDELPGSAAEWQARYGDFHDTTGLQRMQAAVFASKSITTALGTHKFVKDAIASDGDYLTDDAPPTPIYARLIWWAQRVASTTAALAGTLDRLPDALEAPGADGGTTRELLVGPAGIAATLSTLSDEASALRTAIRNVRDRLVPQAEAISGTMLINEVSQDLTSLKTEIDQLRSEAAQEYEDWRDQKLSPGQDPPSPESLSTPTGSDWPWRRSKSQRAKAKYAELVAAFKQASQQEQRKAQFVTEASGLDAVGTRAIQSLAHLESDIGEVARLIDAARDRVTSVAAVASEKQLTDARWLVKAIDLNDVLALTQPAKTFVTGALVEQPTAAAGSDPGADGYG